MAIQDSRVLGKLNLQSLVECSHGQNSELFGEWEIRPSWSVVQPRELNDDSMGVDLHSMRFVTKGNLMLP